MTGIMALSGTFEMPASATVPTEPSSRIEQLPLSTFTETGKFTLTAYCWQL